MKKIGLLLVLLLASAASAAAAPDMKEGRWEFLMLTEIPGLPFPMPPVKTTTCLTGDDAVPQKPNPEQNCKILEQKVNGNTVSWVMECKDAGSSVRSQGEIVYQGSSFAGTMLTRTTGGDGEMEMNQKINGRYLGPCK